MRKFSSYGPIDTSLHYYAPRTALIDRTFSQLLGENPQKGGHYMTVRPPDKLLNTEHAGIEVALVAECEPPLGINSEEVLCYL